MRFLSRNAGAALAMSLSVGGLLPAQAAGVASEMRLLQVRSAQVRSTILAQSAQRPGVDPATLRVTVETGSGQQVLMLRVNHSLGAWAARQQPTSVAFEGYLPDLAGSWVRVTRTGSRWVGIWFDGATYHGIDSARAVARANADAAAAAPDSLVVFRLADAVVDGPVLADDTVRPTLNGEALMDLVATELQAPATAAALSPMRRLNVGLIADAELVARDGASTTSNLLARLNIVDGIFASQVGVRIQAENPTLLEAATQPFSGTTASTLLDQLRDYRGGSSAQRATGLSHLMTGRDLDGQTAGIAYLSSVADGVALCTSRYSASLSEARRNVNYDALIAAHEIGHVFGAPHDGETDPQGNLACAAEPSSFLMASTISFSQTFSSCSLAQMAPILEIAKSQCLVPFETDLSVTAASDAPAVTIDSETGVTLTLRNLGNSGVTDAQLVVAVPAGLSLSAVTATGISCALSGGAVACTPSALAAGSSATVRLALRGATAGPATVDATITSSVTDPQPGNNRAQASITVNSAAVPPPTTPASNGTKSGGGKAGVELWLALLLLAQRLWASRLGRQPDAVAKKRAR